MESEGGIGGEQAKIYGSTGHPAPIMDSRLDEMDKLQMPDFCYPQNFNLQG